MPRGRAGLDLIPAERVLATFKRVYGWRHSPTHIGEAWHVSERTVRRWQQTGLPLCYGRVWITRAEWEAFEKTGAVPKSRTSPPTGAALKWWPMRGASTKPPIGEISKNRKVSAPRRSTSAASSCETSTKAGRTRLDRQVSARSRGQVRP
jgi:hypothetical protein